MRKLVLRHITEIIAVLSTYGRGHTLLHIAVSSVTKID